MEPGPTGMRRRSASISRFAECGYGVQWTANYGESGVGRTGEYGENAARLSSCLRNLGTIVASFPAGRCSCTNPRFAGRARAMSDQEQTYDDGRVRNLEAMLRALALRIRTLDQEGRLLDEAGELMRLIGDVRS